MWIVINTPELQNGVQLYMYMVYSDGPSITLGTVRSAATRCEETTMCDF